MDSIEEIIEKQGWSDSALVDLLFEYIERQGGNDALRDYLARVAQQENET